MGVLWLPVARRSSSTTTEQQLLSALGNQAAIAIENARLYNRCGSILAFELETLSDTSVRARLQDPPNRMLEAASQDINQCVHRGQ